MSISSKQQERRTAWYTAQREKSESQKRALFIGGVALAFHFVFFVILGNSSIFWSIIIGLVFGGFRFFFSGRKRNFDEHLSEDQLNATLKTEYQEHREKEGDKGIDIVKWEVEKGMMAKNTATTNEVVQGLGSKYPIKLPDPSVQDFDFFKTAQEVYRFDGHTPIGGSIFWDGQGHMITVGGARVGGKGSCLILPALLSPTNFFPGATSFVCLDPKGENIAVSGRFLKEAGYNVICINPFQIPEIVKFGNSGFNVFDTFSANDFDFDKFADMIANSIVVSVPGSHPHFDKTARSYISLYIRHLMTQNEEPKNFTTLYRWLRLAGDERMDFLQNKIGRNNSFDGDVSNEAFSIFSQISSGAGKEVESTYSTIRAATDCFKSMPLRDSISRSDFDMTSIAKEKTAIFVCMNPSDLNDNQAWLRILFGSMIRTLTKHYSKTRKVVMIMDEFPTMGYFKEFEIMSGFMAGYNVTLWPIMQDLTQLKGLYPKTWETFINNAVIRHFTGIGDNFTADYVSKRLPVVNTGSEDKPRYEPILRADEVMTNENIIAFISGVKKPVFMYKTPYWERSIYRGGADPNPFR
ncbi:type IV secretory system conjugative DNA transfer family protein [Dyadobacter sp. CY327]|uniref:type IV secretory system conjugative DNA transfer family protein n=1 Tax=Dyadobacter sp. CY327 TaxID=2907301 RepID=UPI001F38EAB4|nr:type IV secretory system conjugative DNA transfer family protein [Dyadobacter sp. CY327]MCE7073701.1 type IV secretory system conjugative DNA transfer family protein [Dyadobacter sp. CY327]